MNLRTALWLALVIAVPGCSGPRTEEPALPSVARIVCEAGGARAVTPAVRAVTDGVRLVFDNRSGARQFYIRSGPDEDHGGRLTAGVNEMTTTMPPGEINVGCFEKGSDVSYSGLGPEFATVVVADPDGLWVEPELGCEQGPAKRYEGGPAEGEVRDDAPEVIRTTVPGILPTDAVVRPGYPGTQWHSEFHHVVRGGSAIAEASVWKQYGRWNVELRPCSDAVIG